MPSPGSLAEREEAFGPPPRPALDIAFADSAPHVVIPLGTPKRLWEFRAYGPFESFVVARDWLLAQGDELVCGYAVAPLVAPEHRDLGGAWLGVVTDEPEGDEA